MLEKKKSSAELIREMAKVIAEQTNDLYLKELMASFDTLPTEVILDELKRYNAGHRPLWLSRFCEN
jgi:hypothetical protein